MAILHYFGLCPFSRQVRLALHEKQLPYRLEEEKPWLPSQRFLSLNPTGAPPVLETKDLVLTHEYAICEYLEETDVQINLIGKTAAQKAETRRLIHWFNVKFYGEVVVNLVFEKVIKRQFGQGGPDSIALRRGRTNILEHLNYITLLCDHRKWLAGDAFSLADIVAASHLSCLDYLGDVPWGKYDGAKEWYVRIKSRPTFRPFLKEGVPGVIPAPHYSQLDF